MTVFSLHSISEWIRSKGFSKVIVFTDSNTSEHCLPVLKNYTDIAFEEISIPAGEASKNLEQAGHIWELLLQLDADRNALLLNLGGGMITDIGGFCAATYKRGISFINVPTTLLGMVDAAIGGKTGINLGLYKNQVGLFSAADAVFIDPAFLKTLPLRELKSGFAEVLKYGLIKQSAVSGQRSEIRNQASGVRGQGSDYEPGLGGSLWEKLKVIEPKKTEDWLTTIIGCVAIKERIVSEDPKETGLRKILNFGHTIGHGIESYSLANHADPLLHGEAVAIGMIVEAYLSFKKSGLPEQELHSITETIVRAFGHYIYDKDAMKQIIGFILKDKKNAGTEVRFVLLQQIGKAVFDINCPIAEIEDALNYYMTLNYQNL